MQCHKYLSAVYNVTRTVMLRYINMDNFVLFCVFKRKKPALMHYLEEESKLDCKFRLRAWYTPTQHRTPDYDTYLVWGRLTALCRINRMYAALIRDTVMMARKLVLCWAQEIRQFPAYSNPTRLTHHELLLYKKNCISWTCAAECFKNRIRTNTTGISLLKPRCRIHWLLFCNWTASSSGQNFMRKRSKVGHFKLKRSIRSALYVSEVKWSSLYDQ
jgi:hypothetical protein